MPLCSRLRPDVRNRQTDVRQTSDVRCASSLNASVLWGGGLIKRNQSAEIEAKSVGSESLTFRCNNGARQVDPVVQSSYSDPGQLMLFLVGQLQYAGRVRHRHAIRVRPPTSQLHSTFSTANTQHSHSALR